MNNLRQKLQSAKEKVQAPRSKDEEETEVNSAWWGPK